MTKPSLVAGTPVTLSTTAAASVGTLVVPVPVTCTSTVAPAPGFHPV